MNVIFDEQDIMDALCVFTAARKHVPIETINADYFYDPAQGGHYAQTQSGFREIDFDEQDIRDAIIYYLEEFHHYPADRLGVELMYNEVHAEKHARIYVVRPDISLPEAIDTFNRLVTIVEAVHDHGKHHGGRERI